MRRNAGVLLVAGLALALLGCARDVVKTLQKDPELQSRVIGAIAGDSALTGQMIDRLLPDESSRRLLLEKVTANGDAMQALMVNIARDRTRLDGILALAVQDSSMREHVLTLVQGMRMGR